MDAYIMRLLKNKLKFGGYDEKMLTVEQCEKFGLWTPLDLIIGDYILTEGKDSQFKFTQKQTKKIYFYILDNKKMLIEKNYISKNCFRWLNGRVLQKIELWTNYEF